MVYTSRCGDLGHKSTVFKTSPPKKTETGPDCKPVLTGHSKENSGPENLASKLLNNKYLPSNTMPTPNCFGTCKPCVFSIYPRRVS